MAFDVQLTSLALIRSLRTPLEKLQRRNAALTDQTRRAASSIVLNLSEGNQRAGKDRTQLWRCAAGSAAEVSSALAVALAWGYLEEEELREPTGLLDRVRAMLWKLTH